jgi:hypothetical protein
MTLQKLPGVVLTTTFSLFVSFAAEAGAQSFTKADSGWVRVFNGTDFTGFYSRTYNVSGANAPLVTPPGSPYTIEYAGTDTATIRVGTTSNQGNIGTLDTTFSHFRLRWEMKHDVVNGNNNAGLTYHVDESAIRMQNNWPRSIEMQGKQSEAGSAFSIQQVTFNTNATGGEGSNYSPTAAVKTGCEIGCNGRWYKGNPLIPAYETATPTVTRWLRFQLVARGADSALHIVNDTTVMRLWNIRIFNDSTRATGSTSSGQTSASNKTPARPWDHGGLAWQAEGSLVRYRRLEVMRIPPSTPMNEHFLHRLFLDSTGSYVAGRVDTIRWRGIGTIPKVKLEYQRKNPLNSPWVTIVDSTPNTGSYAWNTPIAAGGLILLRISGPDWVQADTVNTGVMVAGILPGATQGKLSFSVPLQGSILTGLSSGTRIEIRDASGNLVRSLILGDESSTWDLADSQGIRVPPGMYFLRALSGTTAYRMGRTLVR